MCVWGPGQLGPSDYKWAGLGLAFLLLHMLGLGQAGASVSKLGLGLICLNLPDPLTPLVVSYSTFNFLCEISVLATCYIHGVSL